jgi:hypothetical protein
MGTKSQEMLTKSAKQLANSIREDSNLTLKLIMSAGMFAFAALPADKQMEYVARAQMPPARGGGRGFKEAVDHLKQVAFQTKIELLSESDAELVRQIQHLCGPEVAKSAAAAMEDEAATGDASDQAERSNKQNRHTG